ncbi:uncharacterized protein LOC143744765 isoform X3 [Siphateles boraxobius]|uniref:uncharacterized protein LOC143744765 isoform X3 n=1 Tax=Siphateles boraxobius TaxID=180520 RepID=UPI004063F6D4
MVGLMKFSLDFGRLLGLSGSSDERPEEMDTGTLPGQNDHMLSQDVLNGEEGLSEEEKARRKAERRKAKRKRQRQRKKLERVKKDESTEQEEDENAGADSELEESEESEPEELEDIGLSKVEEKPVASPSKSLSGPPLASGNKSNRQPTARSSEEDPGWDVNSAFVANAVNHIRPKAKSKGAHKSKENKENESRTGEVIGLSDVKTKRSALLVEKGIRFVQEGQYTQAVSLFTEAIKCDPKDYRFFGNRSYCYCCLEQYPLALADAEKSIHMAPDWPKGYYRRGSALMGLKRYSEAEKAMEQVLKLDRDCEEAVNDLLYSKVQQLTDFGYDEEQSIQLLEKYDTVQAVVAAKASNQDCALLLPSPCNSLWVGNVTTELTEKHLRDLFKSYGEIDSIRVLHERFCAFVNFKNANMASRAMENLNGHFIENTRLVVRYPDRRIQKVLPTPAIQQPAGAAGRFERNVHTNLYYFQAKTQRSCQRR